MTWPTTQTTNSLDADSDTLQNARPEVKGLADKFNLLVAHVTAFMQGLLSSATAADARATLDVPSRNGAGASGIWGIAVTGSAATASTATNCTRSVQGSGLASGGGVLNIDRIITVTASTQAEAEAGTENATAMTPLRTAQAITARTPAIGVGQTWQDVFSSRSAGTSYQNTTARPIAVAISVRGNASAQVSADGSAWVRVATFNSVEHQKADFIIPAWHYYRVSGSYGSFPSADVWAELR